MWRDCNEVGAVREKQKVCEVAWIKDIEVLKKIASPLTENQKLFLGGYDGHFFARVLQSRTWKLQKKGIGIVKNATKTEY